ncbi:DHH family phosphoesterase [Streptomyces wuyuanensis]|uniref:DHH family phosphoesterase n=1 Tax=Streptomyces wuyuanensis TaxID=1196353 RepID=UPI00380CAA0D
MMHLSGDMPHPSCYVFSYVNPDADGVCSSIAYAEMARRLRGDEYVPLVWGVTDESTRLALARFSVPGPAEGGRLPEDSRIVLVDTHHLRQLPPDVDTRQVVEIIDHHPRGEVEAFPNARIQNEQVGAAATLIAERFHAAGLDPSPAVAGLLASAVVCNTLNLTSPSTSERDHRALERLRVIADFPSGFVTDLLDALGGLDCRDMGELLSTHAKQFRFGDVEVQIVQLESSEPGRVLARPDLEQEIRAIAERTGVDHCLVSVLGLADRTTTVVAPDSATRILLGRALDLNFNGSSARVDRFLLRKTDLVPGLIRCLEPDFDGQDRRG